MYRRTHEAKAIAKWLTFTYEKLVAQGPHIGVFICENNIQNSEIISSLSLYVDNDNKVKDYYKDIEEDIGRQLMEEFENDQAIDNDIEEAITNQMGS